MTAEEIRGLISIVHQPAGEGFLRHTCGQTLREEGVTPVRIANAFRALGTPPNIQQEILAGYNGQPCPPVSA